LTNNFLSLLKPCNKIKPEIKLRNLVQKTLLISSLLISTASANFSAEDRFTDWMGMMAPTLPMQDGKKVLYSPRSEELPAQAAKYFTQRPFSKSMVKKVAGDSAVFTLENAADATDGSYLLLRQSDLTSGDSFRTLNAILNKPTDLHIILDVEADSNGVLNLYSMVGTVHDETGRTTTLRRALPFFKHLHLINSARDVKTIGKSFLYGDKYLEDISFTGFEGVKKIEDGFMVLCSKLQSADLSSFEHVKSIGNVFMADAKSLTSLTLPTTRIFNADLKTVGDHFLRGATSLTHVPEEAFESVMSMGSYFMASAGLTRFNTAKFKDLENLGVAFLAKCDSLKTVDVSGLKRIEPASVTFADAEAAQEIAKEARSKVHSNVREAWAAHTDAEYAYQEAATAEKVALKHAEAAKAVIITSKKEKADKVREAAEAKIYAAKDVRAQAETKDVEADRQVEMTQTALAIAKAAKAKAATLLTAAKNKQRHNLGLLHDCTTLKANPEAIRGAWSLLAPLRYQLSLEYKGLELENDDCGC
jgi:hypothetical protein